MEGAGAAEAATSVVLKSQSSPWPIKCENCPCQTFASADAVTSAVNSDARTQALIEWLSNSVGPPRRSGQKPSPIVNRNTPCGNRLQASIVVLNAIRDACRPFLESPAIPTLSSNGSTGKNSPSRHLVSTYQDSFPPMPANAKSAVAPTLLVGRKKRKGKKSNSTSTLPCHDENATTNSHNEETSKTPARSTDTKKRIKPVNIPLPANSSALWDNYFPPLPKGNISLSSGTFSAVNLSPGSREKTKAPVEVSTKKNLKESKSHAETDDLNRGSKTFVNTAVNVGGYLISDKETTFLADNGRPKSSSRPASGATKTACKNFVGDILYESDVSPEASSNAASSNNAAKESNSNKPTQKSTELEATERTNVVEGSSSTEIPRTIPRNSSFASDPHCEMVERLVKIYSTIMKHQLAPCLLLELHLLVRLLTTHDNPHKISASRMNLPSSNVAFIQIFSSAKSCQQFAAKTLSELEFLLVNLGHETMKMFVSLPALKKNCQNLWNSLDDAIQAGNTSLMFEVDQKALGANTNTPHLTLPFDQLRDSRHNYKTVDLNRLFKEREELRDAFLYQLRAFQDVRGRLVDNEQAGKIINSIKRESKEILSYVSTNNLSWFVNFFCDLLLQVGLVPIGETDSEVVRQIVDQKRLQVSLPGLI